MVKLMLQPVFLGLVRGSEDYRMTSDDLYQMWAVSTSAKSAMVQGRRLENLTWRLWYTSTIRGRLESELSAATTGDESQTESSSNHESTIIPRGRALFASTCTSILAEIQDASMRPTSRPFSFGIPFSGGPSTAAAVHSSEDPSSPPIRARSPGLSSEHRKKKNIDKFLKKFRSNLEDISELFDEKATLNTAAAVAEQERTDDEETETTQLDSDETQAATPHMSQFSHSPEFLSPQQQQQPSYGTPAGKKWSADKPRQQHKSILARLIQRSSLPASPLAEAASKASIASPAIPEPKQAVPSFLNGSGSFVSNQLEMLARGRFDRSALSPTLQRTRSMTPTIGSDQAHSPNLLLSTTASPPIRTSKINTATLSSSLSAGKKIEDTSEDSNFDAQMIIW